MSTREPRQSHEALRRGTERLPRWPVSVHTTVELIVDRVSIVKRIDRIVGVRVLYEETALQSAVRASGATWGKPAKLWRMPYSVALGLGLQDRIVET